MRRAEILRSVQNVLDAFDESGIYALLLASQRELADPSKIFEVFRTFSRLADRFGEAEKKILAVFKLQKLNESAFWASLASKETPPDFLHMRRNLAFLRDQLPRLLRLFEQESQQILELQRIGSQPVNVDIMTVVVIEEAGRHSSPERLAGLLESIESIYDACSIMLGVSGSKLAVVGCDSGSDKSFDFLGAAKVMSCVKDIILSVWDRIVFHRERQLATRIDLIAQALPVLESISSLEQEQKIGPEQAEILRRKLLSGVTKFVESGAVIPEMQERSVFEPRVLMSPEPKLLTAATLAEPELAPEEDAKYETNDSMEVVEEGDDEGISLGYLEPEEREMLTKLLGKAKQK